MKDEQSTEIQPRGLSTAAAASFTGLSASFLEKARLNLTKTPGPKFRRIGKRVIYLLDDLNNFLDSSGQG